MDWDRRRFDDRRGGESYRPTDRPGRSPSRGYDSRNRRSPPRNRSRLRADTWLPSSRGYGRPRSRTPPDYRRRSRTPPFQGRGFGPSPYGRRRSPPRRFSPRREERPRSPLPSWRSKSPYSEGRSRDVSRGHSSPSRIRDASPGNQDSRTTRRNSPPRLPTCARSVRALSPRAQATSFRSQSPSHVHARRELSMDMSRGRHNERSRPVSPVNSARPASNTTSRRSSPATGPEHGGLASGKSRSRSPMRPSPPHRSSGLAGPPSYRDRESTQTLEAMPFGRGQGNPNQPEGKSSEPVQSRFGGYVPTQPRNTGNHQSPPSGPSQGPRAMPPHPRGSHNMNFLSAPTRPRRGPAARDGPWPGAPMTRRGPPTTTPHTPSGPRASFTPPMPGGSFRHPGSRQNSTAPVVSSPVIKPPNHLAGLCTLIPGGRTLTSVLEVATEKRLSQLEVDQEKLLEQMAESQKLKRAGLRDWDRLDHESSICALKSELAEGHLQRMADETIGGGIPF